MFTPMAQCLRPLSIDLLVRRFAWAAKKPVNAVGAQLKNEMITSREITLIDDAGVRQVLPLCDVLPKVDRKLFDLVQVNAAHTPPICRLVSRSNVFKRQLASEEAVAKQRLKNREKEIRFGTSMAEHDFVIKLNRVKEMLEKAFRVRVVVEPKGAANSGALAKEALWRKVLTCLSEQYSSDLTIISAPAVEFRNLIATVALLSAKPPCTKGHKQFEDDIYD